MRFPTPRRIAFGSSRHPWRVIGAWAVAMVAIIGVIAALLGGATTADVNFRGTPESIHGQNLMDQRLGKSDSVVEAIVVRGDEPRAVRRTTGNVAAAVRGLDPGIVSSVVAATDPRAPANLVSPDGTKALVMVTMTGNINEAEVNVPSLRDAAAAESNRVGDTTVQMAGPASARDAMNVQAEKDLLRGELMFGLPVAMIILFFVFRAVGAALLPFTVAVVSIVVALGGVSIAGSISQLSFFVTNMVTMMGLAVGIDYALFIVSRYREERASGKSVLDAVDRASETSGRAVAYSGLAVVVALAGLLVVPASIFGSLALGAIFVVLAAVLASMTLLPAMMVLMGDRVDFGSLPRRRTDENAQARGFARLAQLVMRRPVIAFSLTAAAMLALALPYTGVNTGQNGIESLAPSSSVRQAYDVMSTTFHGGGGGPVIVVLDGDVTSGPGAAAVARVAKALEGEPRLSNVRSVVGPSGDIATVSADVGVPPASDEAGVIVNHLRDSAVPQAINGTSLDAAVTGEAAFNVDFFDLTDRYLIPVISLVLALSFLVLLVAFRSVVVPVLAIIMNLLSVGAAYGLIVAVFQHGFASDILRFRQVESIEAWLPLFLFAVLFGLSMDYHVFLLSRIKERYDATGDNELAIRGGIASSARLITGAAAIMVAVFAGFAMGELVMFQQMGFGLAVAIFLDATIVRIVLVPAAMRLLGDANWYLPKFLSFLPQVDVEGARDTIGEPLDPVASATATE